MNEATFFVTADGSVALANPAAAELLGVPLDRLTRSTIHELAARKVWPDGSPCLVSQCPIMRAATLGVAQPPTTVGVYAPDGSARWLQVTATPAEDAEGNVAGSVATFTDTMCRLKANPLPTFIWHAGHDGRIHLLEYNDAGAAFSGGNVHEYVGKTATAMYADMPEIVEVMQQCAEQRASLRRRHLYRFRSMAKTTELDVTYVFVAPDLIVVYVEPAPGAARAEGASAAEPLSPQETEVLRRLALGKPYAEIAAELDISVNSVGTYRNRIAAKLGLKGRAALVEWAVARGLVGAAIGERGNGDGNGSG